MTGFQIVAFVKFERKNGRSMQSHTSNSGHTPDRTSGERLSEPQFALDAKTAAKFIGTEVGAIRKLVERRKISYNQEGPGCRVWIARRDLDAFMRRTVTDRGRLARFRRCNRWR